MGYKTFASLNIAVIGEETPAVIAATTLAHSGHNILIGAKKYNGALSGLFAGMQNVQQTDIDVAAAGADVIIVKAPKTGIREIAYLLDDVRRKIIIDASYEAGYNNGPFINTVTALTSITGSAHVVRCIDSKHYQHIIEPVFGGRLIDMFVAGDSKKGKELTRILGLDMGYTECCDFGGTGTVHLLDEMAKCWKNMARQQPAYIAKIGKRIKK